jgi:hypothetical protein
MATRKARVLRGVVASSIAVFTAVLAHVAGGGVMPGPAELSLVFAFSTLACIALAGRRLSRLRVAISVILSQGLFHVLFAVTGATTTMPAPSRGPMADMIMSPVAPRIHAAPAMPETGWMWLAHAAAAALTIVALVWGETALRAVLERTILAITSRLPAAPHGQPRPWLPALGFVRDGRDAEFLRTGLRHRGPPRRELASA